MGLVYLIFVIVISLLFFTMQILKEIFEDNNVIFVLYLISGIAFVTILIINFVRSFLQV